MKEEWKRIIIDGDVTNYEISSIGRCRNIKKLHWKTKGILKPKYNKHNGYENYMLACDRWDRYRNFYIHRLILMAFKPTEDLSLHVNHIDGNKRNNVLSNLEWCTQKENMVHASENELIGKPVLQYSLKGDFIKRFSSATEAENTLGITQRCISQALNSNMHNSQSGGFQWRFEDDDTPVYNVTDSYKSMKKGIVKLSLKGDFIEEFEYSTLAYDSLGKRDNGYLHRVATRPNNVYEGYKWVFSEDYYGSPLA